MDKVKGFLNIGEYMAAGLFEEQNRSMFYRKSLGLRRYYEHVELLPYKGGLLYPAGRNDSSMVVHCGWSNGYLGNLTYNFDELAKKDEELARIFDADFGNTYSYMDFVPEEHSIAGRMWTHSMPNYERILEEGFDSYETRIKKIKDKDIREGLLHLVSGIRTYRDRCVEYLECCGADEKLIDALKRVPFEPACNIYEAIVGWNFVMYLDNVDNLGCIASGFMKYYNGEDITKVLGELFDNLNVNGGWSMSLGADYSPLTLQCLEALKGKRRPMAELFVSDDMGDEIWNKAIEVIKTNGGQPAFYNHKLYYEGFRERFREIDEEDLNRFCGGGCSEMMIAGKSNVGSLDAGINTALILSRSIKSHLESAENFDDFYRLFINDAKNDIDVVTESIYKAQKHRSEVCPLPMRTLLVDDCIDKGIEYNNGGAKYMWSTINFAGLINVIDSLLVIRDFVFDKKIMSGKKMAELLENNDSEFLEQTRNHTSCVGVDDEAANEMANKVSTDLFAIIDGKKTYFGSGFVASSIQFNTSIWAGKKVGATPDGRKYGAPLCDSLTAIMGKDTKGATALINSITSLNLKKAIGTPIVNFTINPSYDNKIFKSLIKSYFSLGGMHMQITCASKEMLEDAYKTPDNYRNLVVRVGGYSEYFNNLEDDMKKEIIKRTIYA